MAQILKPHQVAGEVGSVSQLLEEITKWQKRHPLDVPDVNRRVWFRGHGDCRYMIWPGVYREGFTDSSKRTYGTGIEEKRLNLEREMLSDFRTSGATLFDADKIVDVYFAAQHFGMPTRLLDWTTNPLTSLFFAVQDADEEKAGELLMMDAQRLFPDGHKANGILTMRHPYAVDAIGTSFWHKPKQVRPPLILPVRPDNRYGRIGQQSSCFTLHMHEAEDYENPTLDRVTVPGKTKHRIREELKKLNVNEFTIYNDLDHLGKHVKQTWLGR